MRHRVIVVGAGHWGKNLVRTFKELGALAGVAEADPELRKALSELYPGTPIYADYNEAFLRCEGASGAVVATPAHTHYAVAERAIRSGFHTFVEKPITLASAEAEALVALARDHGRVLMVGHLLLYQPAIQELKRFIDQGKIGRLYSLHQERMKLGRVRSVENVLWSFGVHDLAVILHLVGSKPDGMTVVGQCTVQDGVEDDVHLHLQFSGGVSAHLHTSWVWPETRRRLTVLGDRGMIVYDEEAQTLTFHNKGIYPNLSAWDEGYELLFQGSAQPLTLECQHFLSCMERSARPLSDGGDGAEVVRILEEADKRLKG